MTRRRINLKRVLREMGHTREAKVWETALRLLPGWTGTYAELVNSAEALEVS